MTHDPIFVPHSSLRELRDQPEEAARLAAALQAWPPEVHRDKGLPTAIQGALGWLATDSS